MADVTDTTSTRPQMGDELLPCPFCGAEPSGPQKYASAEWNGARSITCSNSDCVLFFYRSNRYETREQTDANLIARWNTRTFPTMMKALEKASLWFMAKNNGAVPGKDIPSAFDMYSELSSFRTTPRPLSEKDKK